MSFQWPYVLFALPFVVAGLLALFASTQRARARLLECFAAARLLPMLLISYSPALRFIKHTLVASGVLLAVFALARPQWGYDWQENSSRGVDVVFVIDTSRSMLTPDVQPNRLERAKLAIYDCLEKMAGNRVGLVAFAGDAFLQCPLTLDYDAFRQTLEAVDTNTIARGGTDIAVGLDAAATALDKSGSNKIIVLLTDGEDLEDQGVAEAKTLADQGLTIYTVGVGTTEGELIPIRDASGRTDFVRDQRGELVKSHLDSTTLSDIATATHGFYQPLGATGEGLQRVYENGIKKLPEQNIQSQMRRQPIERFQWPLAAGTVLLAIEMLLGTRRPAWRRRDVPMENLSEPLSLAAKPTKTANQQKNAPSPKIATVLTGVLLLAVILPGIPQAYALDNLAATGEKPAATSPTPTATNASPKAAEKLFEKGDYQAAADAYNQAAAAKPGDGRMRYNEGTSLYRNHDYEGAAQALVKSLSSSELPLQQRAYYNLGNANYRLGESQLKQEPQRAQETWEAASKNYQNALDLNPADADARYNLNLVKQQLDELKKQLEQQQKSQKQDKSDQKQDQQDQQNQQQNQQDQNQQKQDQQNQQNQSQNSQNQPDSDQKQNQSQSSQQNQSGQQNSSSSQKQSGQQASSGNQGQKQSQSQNQSNGGQSPNQKNSSGQQSQTAQNNPQNGGQKQPQNSQGQSGQQSQSKSAQNGDKQPPNGQKQGANQAQPSSSADTNTGKEPAAQKTGQQTAGTSPASGQPSAANSGDTKVTGTVVLGVMTREEAQQLLNSLKPNERKLPASRLQSPSQQSSSDQTYKDW